MEEHEELRTMCSLFSSPTKLAQKIKNSKFIFLFLHFLSNRTHKITQIYKIKRHAHKNLQNKTQKHSTVTQSHSTRFSYALKPNTKRKHKNQTQNSNWTPLIFSNLPFSLPKLWQLFLTPWPASLLISTTAGTKIDGGLLPHHLWLTHSHDSFKSLSNHLWLIHSHESLSLSPK